MFKELLEISGPLGPLGDLDQRYKQIDDFEKMIWKEYNEELFQLYDLISADLHKYWFHSISPVSNIFMILVILLLLDCG